MLQQKLSLFEEWRAQSKPLPKGSAPLTSSSHFKLPSSADKPKAKDFGHRFSLESLSQRASSLKAAAATGLTRPDMITLGTARPSPEYFPWTSLNMETRECKTSCNVGEEAYDLSEAMNYGYAAGSPQLLRSVTEHVELMHDPPYADWEACLTCGTSSALDILLNIFCDRGDWVIAEQYTYSGAKDVIEAHGLRILGVEMDDFGLRPDELQRKLDAWDESLGNKPFLLYMIPTGHNPTGSTQSPERRRAIYDVAEAHDLFIIEDDPYAYLQLQNNSAIKNGHRDSKVSGLDTYLAQLPLSYLSLDTSGRVVRLDSTAKILAPGLRLGWLTASPQTVRKFLAYTELGVVAPSGPSQVMAFKLLQESWGHRGVVDWLNYLSSQYGPCRDILIQACKRHLPQEVCQWKTPSAGMFLWVHVDQSKHLQAQNCSGEQMATSSEIEDRIYAKAREFGVLISRGSWSATGSGISNELCFRLTFAAAAKADLEETVKRSARAIDTEFKFGLSGATP